MKKTCEYCGGPILEFETITHVGCAKLAGIKEVVEWIRFYSRQPCIYPQAGIMPIRGIFEYDWKAKLNEWGVAE